MGRWTAHTSGVSEAPTDGKLYSRQSSAWTPTVVPMGSNRIINGDMRIDQRNNGASGTAAITYTVDRWKFSSSQAGKITWQQIAAGPGLAALGFGYYFSLTSSSAYVPIVTDSINFQQSIEADMISDLAWGTANAQPITLSFLVASSLSGMFSGSIRNYAATRSYPFTFSIPSGGAWNKIVIIIPGDTAGAWALSGNSGGLTLDFDLGCGTNLRGPANAWAAANYLGATGAVSVVATNGAYLYVTGVKLEIGSVATPFNRQSLAKSMADCQRYFYSGTPPLRGIATGTTSGGAGRLGVRHPVSMRAAPTLIIVTPLAVFDGTTTTTVTAVSTTYASTEVLEFDGTIGVALGFRTARCGLSVQW